MLLLTSSNFKVTVAFRHLLKHCFKGATVQGGKIISVESDKRVGKIAYMFIHHIIIKSWNGFENFIFITYKCTIFNGIYL